ncbi:MAG: hypothetical protein V9G19_27010 [Tetrasphaera sp.]
MPDSEIALAGVPDNPRLRAAAENVIEGSRPFRPQLHPAAQALAAAYARDLGIALSGVPSRV